MRQPLRWPNPRYVCAGVRQSSSRKHVSDDLALAIAFAFCDSLTTLTCLRGLGRNTLVQTWRGLGRRKFLVVSRVLAFTMRSSLNQRTSVDFCIFATVFGSCYSLFFCSVSLCLPLSLFLLFFPLLLSPLLNIFVQQFK